MKKVYNFEQYDLLIGRNAVDLFNYFGLDNFHGVNLNDCKQRIKNSRTYIDGFCNTNPINSKPFVFINRYAIKNKYKKHEKVTLIMHEMMHLSSMLYGNFEDQEEEIITFAEMETNRVYKMLKDEKMF